jgi:hypothetical protein
MFSLAWITGPISAALLDSLATPARAIMMITAVMGFAMVGFVIATGRIVQFLPGMVGSILVMFVTWFTLPFDDLSDESHWIGTMIFAGTVMFIMFAASAFLSVKRTIAANGPDGVNPNIKFASPQPQITTAFLGLLTIVCFLDVLNVGVQSDTLLLWMYFVELLAGLTAFAGTAYVLVVAHDRRVASRRLAATPVACD